MKSTFVFIVIMILVILLSSIYVNIYSEDAFDHLFEETKQEHKYLSKDGKLKIITIKTKNGDIRISQYQDSSVSRDFLVLADKNIVAPNGFISYDQFIMYNAYLSSIGNQ